jgi:hypothetical protein
MTIPETTIAKLQQLSEPLLQEVTDFIDFVIHKHQVKIKVNNYHLIIVKECKDIFLENGLGLGWFFKEVI